jgi:microcystin-dependent protein
MGVEIATFISGLTASWPPSADPKSQGDDHIRLLKSVLQSTFPNATKPFYFAQSLSGVGPTPTVLTAAHDKATLYYTTGGGDATVTLPSGLALADAGWSVEVVKYDVAANGVMVVPASGSIITQSGSVASVRVGSVCSPVTFKWGGAGWFAFRHGALIGSTINWDTANIPPGHFLLDGSAYNTTTFAELFATLGTATLRDKRGRVEAGVDGGTGRLSASYFGSSPVINAVGGLEYNSLDITKIPNHAHANTATVNDPGHVHGGVPLPASVAAPAGGPNTIIGTKNTDSAFTGISVTMNNAFIGGGQAHANVQPTIVSNKIIRAC